ncbi:MAG: efflux transporter outer membrane subunit [Dissulfurispiraceae bacterium]|jgi:multidrug efflux system outer membrane protein|nr:efflux transporter outer membrane subunit [Dissulfurispiraceae bacterium]
MNRPQLMKKLVFCAAAMAILSGCASMAPEYKRPDAPVPAAWPSGESYRETSAGRSASEIRWQEFFSDPKLQEIIKLVLENNRDLRVAALNIEKSRALYRIQRTELFPAVNAAGSSTAQRTPADLSPTGMSATTHQYSADLGFSSYELDLFGRIRSLNDQALQEFFATEQARSSVQISLISEAASRYLSLAADKEKLKIIRETLKSQLASYNLIKSRYEAGAASELDLKQAQTSVDTARVEAVRYVSLIAQNENALALIAGTGIPAELMPEGLSEITSFNDLNSGLPAETLLKRPDILQAEHMLKAYNANIGAARAAFFPRITLTTGFGLASNELSGLFHGGPAATWNFIPKITMPIFDAGKNEAALKASELNRDIYLAQYEKAIQTAFREVADALAQKGTINEQIEAQESLTNATARAFSLSEARYNNGISSYLEVLDAQRSLFNAQQELITAQLSRLINLVTLYKVLGGGSNQE